MKKQGMKKVLIINIYGIGDVLFTTPLIENLKAHSPKIQIGYLANRRAAQFLERHPSLCKVHVYERDEWQSIQQKSKFQYLQKIFGLVQEIKKEHYDLVMDLSLNGFMGFLSFGAGIPRRVGFDFRNRGFFLTKKIPFFGYEKKHVVDCYLDLLRELAVPIQTRQMKLPLAKQDRDWAEGFLINHGVGRGDLVMAVFPGGGASWGQDAVYKRWAPEKFAQLVDQLIEKYYASVFLMGSEKEKKLLQGVSDKMTHRPSAICSGNSLLQSAAVLERCALVITNDGGPLHMATAVGTKTVSIFGPVPEQVYGPYPPEGHAVVTSNIACRPCYRHFRRASCDHINCLKNIAMNDVLEKVDQILQSPVSSDKS